MNNVLNTMVECIGVFLFAYVVSCILLTVFKTLLEKKKIENVSEKWFDNYFLILMTIFNLICFGFYYYK